MSTTRLMGRMSFKSRTMALLLGASVLALAPTLVKAQDIGGMIGGMIGRSMMGGGGGGYYHHGSGRSHRHYSSRHESRHASRSRRHHHGDSDEDTAEERSPERSADRSGGGRPADRPAEKSAPESAPVVPTGYKAAPAKSESDDPVLPPAR